MIPNLNEAQIKKVRSVKAKLQNTAVKLKIRLSDLQILYYQERLLARLAGSPVHAQFILKGGLYLYARAFKQPSMVLRPTRDVDLLARGLPSEILAMTELFKSVAAVDLNDGVLFDIDTLEGTRIKEGMDYQGVRITMMGYLERSRERIQIDIGYGDPVTPKPISFAFPSLLDQDFELKAYSLETVIAEKFQAMVFLGEINTRYKDFWDLIMLSQTSEFLAQDLQAALTRTFQHRGTTFEEAKILFSASLNPHPIKELQWTAYLKKLQYPHLPFQEVISALEQFISPLLETEYGPAKRWNPQAKQWQ